MDNFKLKNWIIDVKAHSIRLQDQSEDDAIVLQKRVMDVLLYFSERPGEVVTRDQLVASLWQGAVVGDDAITNTVVKLRKAFGDKAKDPKVIETIPKVGYRLLLTPEPLEAPQPAEPEPEPEPQATEPQVKQQSDDGEATTRSPPEQEHTIFHHKHFWHGRNIFLAIVAIIVFTVLVVVKLQDFQLSRVVAPKSDNGPVAVAKPRLAVLPLRSVGDTEFSYIADGLTAELINTMTRMDGIEVVARASTFAMRSQALNNIQSGVKLQAEYVLDGEIERVHDKLKLKVDLIKPRHNMTAWHKTYEKHFDSLFELQSALIADLKQQLNLTQGDHKPVAKRFGNHDVDAYDFYLLGRYYLNQNTAQSVGNAIEMFEQAVMTDPEFALAQTALAQSWLNYHHHGQTDLVTASRHANDSLSKAMSVAPTLAETHTVLGAWYSLNNEPHKARVAFEKAITLKPNHAEAHMQLGILLQEQKYYLQARPVLEKALELDPQHLQVNRYYGLNLLTMGELDTGMNYLIRAIDNGSGSARTELELAHWYHNYGHQDKTNQWARVAFNKAPEQTDTRIAMAYGAPDPTQMKQWLDKAARSDLLDTFDAAAKLYFYQGEKQALSEHVQQVLYTGEGELNTSHPADWMLWAGLVKLHQSDYQQAASLLELGLNPETTENSDALSQIHMLNELAYTYLKLGNRNRAEAYLEMSQQRQDRLKQNGLRTPLFVVQMVAWYALSDKQNQAEQLLRNAKSKGWRLNHYLAHDPMFEVLKNRQQFIRG